MHTDRIKATYHINENRAKKPICWLLDGRRSGEWKRSKETNKIRSNWETKTETEEEEVEEKERKKNKYTHDFEC